jgi:hypothetical protein
LYPMCTGVLSREQSGCSVMLTAHLRLVLTVRMSGATPHDVQRERETPLPLPFSLPSI